MLLATFALEGESPFLSVTPEGSRQIAFVGQRTRPSHSWRGLRSSNAYSTASNVNM